MCFMFRCLPVFNFLIKLFEGFLGIFFLYGIYGARNWSDRKRTVMRNINFCLWKFQEIMRCTFESYCQINIKDKFNDDPFLRDLWLSLLSHLGSGSSSTFPGKNKRKILSFNAFSTHKTRFWLCLIVMLGHSVICFRRVASSERVKGILWLLLWPTTTQFTGSNLATQLLKGANALQREHLYLLYYLLEWKGIHVPVGTLYITNGGHNCLCLGSRFLVFP